VRIAWLTVALVLALVRPVHAEGDGPVVLFVAVAATRDGGAWVVKQFGPGEDTRTELAHVDTTGRPTVENPPTSSQIKAIAVASDGTLWVLTGDAVLRRDATGQWHRVVLAATSHRDYIVPLAARRALVIRQQCSYCSEVVEVDDDRTSSATFEASIPAAVADGKGGAWAVLGELGSQHNVAGYAHFGADGWESWSFEGLAVDGMHNGGKTTATPTTIVALPDGFAGADQQDLYIVGDDGQPLDEIELPKGALPDDLLSNSDASLPRGDEIVNVMEGMRADTHEPEATLVVQRFARDGESLGSERVDAPRWWRLSRAQGGPKIQASASGSNLWLTDEHVLLWRTDRWHMLTADPQAEAHEFGPRYPFFSFPIEIGGALHRTPNQDLSGSSAFGLRPELVWARSKHYPAIGIGGYAELATASSPGDTLIGGGITAVGYDGTMAAALSLGADLHWFGDRSPITGVASLFLGLRSPGSPDDDRGPYDDPFGLRIDYRPGADTLPTTTTISLVIDIPAIASKALDVVGGIYGLTHMQVH
jgi:hypothetical protein